ncbi:hypothetical protein [Streptomyces dioscori]|uniref:hypothetical protein n=1 Tax=Streptomyces dioscori TaxID=2109333 RepID=UPI001CED9D2B|nr:hypothetical protein [Streptomyces dioscori]
MNGMRKALLVTAVTVCALTGGTVGPAAAVTDPLLPHPGPDGLVWVEEHTGDGGVASGGAWDKLPTILTVACEGGGDVQVTMQSQGTEVAAFSVGCPAGTAGTGSVAMEAGIVRPGSFTITVDASSQNVRWSLTVTQPE